MTKPPPGNYYIVNAMTASNGTPLALTFNGEGARLTVAASGSQVARQVWTVIRNTQLVHLKDNINIKPNTSDEMEIVGGTNSASWIIRGIVLTGVFMGTIADGNESIFADWHWSLKEAAVGQPIILSPLTSDPKQRWQFISAQ